jgi:hypothetical protein
MRPIKHGSTVVSRHSLSHASGRNETNSHGNDMRKLLEVSGRVNAFGVEVAKRVQSPTFRFTIGAWTFFLYPISLVGAAFPSPG